MAAMLTTNMGSHFITTSVCVSTTHAQMRNWVMPSRRENVLALVFRTFLWNVPAVQWNGQSMPAGTLYRPYLKVPPIPTFETLPLTC